ncbi:sensor histidine kinase [Archangium lansingense]|uniref:histidine kinase n=1 Tax=Archangium lansingense TaxID=2995310 RepID=A0ABT4A9T9_9BACT|nr:ATP-binding protein [Archangium lansinium]MCY1078425.1 ATP-binding protein [Archangium lansinium]
MPRKMRQLLWPFLAMLALSIALQAASLAAMLEIEARVDQSQQHVAAAAALGTIVDQFENTTYLALVGLASSDWELLLRQRGAAQTQAQRFMAVSNALLQGDKSGGGALPLNGIQEPEILGVLGTLPGLWEKTHAAHVRVLRSENRSLKNNPDLEQFRAASRSLSGALDDVSVLLQRRSQEELRQLGLVQRIIPVGAFLLTLVIFVFVIQRMLLPFVASTEELGLSEAALRRARDELERRVAERTEELARANEALRQAHDGLELRVKERTQELKDTQRRAVELARQAGMAELATNVLHNVGNVLNSINTSATVLGERLRALRLQSLLKLAGVLEERRADLPAFMTADERGRRLPEFLGKLGENLSSDRDEMLSMTDSLHRHVEHIRMIVELQQSYATSSSLVEPASLEELLEDALRINGAALGRHGITLERHVMPLPRMMVDKHKLLQILLNLISNAKYALNDNPPGERRLTVKLEHPADNRVRVQVCDNGMGIAPELLTKIFQHGFTTRKEGHGFGLHSCAIAARSMEGSLGVHSDGPGKGATFTLELPFRPETGAQNSAPRASG